MDHCNSVLLRISHSKVYFHDFAMRRASRAAQLCTPPLVTLVLEKFADLHHYQVEAVVVDDCQEWNVGLSIRRGGR